MENFPDFSVYPIVQVSCGAGFPNIPSFMGEIMKEHQRVWFHAINVQILFFSMLLAAMLALSGCGEELSEEQVRQLVGRGGEGPQVMVGGLRGVGSGDLQVLDDVTGEFLGVVDTVADCAGTPCEIGRISSSVFDPIGQRLITGIARSNFCAGCVLSIDLTTGIATVLWSNADLQAAVGGDFLVSAVPGMARRSDGKIFAALKQASGGLVGVVMFDLVAPPTYLGLTGLPGGVAFDLGNALAFDSSNNLFFANGAGLSTLNQITGAATLFGPLIMVGFGALALDPNFSRLDAIAVHPGGRKFGIFNDAGLVYFGSISLGTRQFTTSPFYGGAELTALFPTLGNYDGLGFVPKSLLPGIP